MADRISAAHRRIQLAIRAAVIRDLMRLWPAVDINRLPQTWPPFEEAAVLLVKRYGEMSRAAAARYYTEHRRAAGVPGEPPQFRATPTVEQIRTGLRIVGPLEAAQQLALKRTAEDVARKTLVKLAGSVSMYTLDHGRDLLMNAVADDPHARGWARETSQGACAFCQMIAARGPIFSEDTAGFEAHRGCACTPVPVWSSDQPWPAGSREAQARWNEATRGLSGDEARKAFRRALET